MKKVRLIALSLALILILSSCSFVQNFFGGGDEEPELAEGEIDLSEYKIVTSRYFTDVMQDKITEFQYSIEMLTGVSLLKSTDTSRNATENDDPLIVLGPTSHTQSDTAEELLAGRSGYAITRIGKKILIVGSSDCMVSLGMDYFLANCLTGERLAEGIITMEDGFSVKDTTVGSTYLFGGNGGGDLAVVYSKELSNGIENEKGSLYGNEPSNGGLDYLYVEAGNFQTELATLSGGKTVTCVSDKENTGASTVELLFGDTNRSATTTLKSMLTATQYGVYATGAQVAIFGWTESTVMLAKTYFKSLIEYCREYDTEIVRFPTKVAMVQTAAQFAEDVPQFTAATLQGAEDSGSGTLSKDTESGTLLQYYSSATRQDYDDYCKTLENAGYRLYASTTRTNTDTDRDNYYKTYVDDTNMVHVYFIASSDKAASATKGEVRLVTAKLENINLPNLEEQTYKKVTDTMVTQMRLAYNNACNKGTFGLCYIITLEDGSFIVFDGGGYIKDGVTSYDHVRLYTILEERYKAIFGKNPSESDPIVISAWILTHQHWDHYSNFSAFVTDYCAGDAPTVKIEQYICNLGSKAYIYNTYNPDGYGIKSLINQSNACKYPFKIVEAHTGQNIYVRNVMIEVLYTQEDMYPLPLYYYNNTSMITRFHMRVSTAVKNGTVNGSYYANAQTVLFLGDLHYQGDLRLRQMYGGSKTPTAFLKSDVCQIAHHGYNGCSQDLYEVVDADILLWPSDMGNYNNYTGTSTSNGNGTPANGEIYYYKAINRWLVSEEKKGNWVILMADDYNYTLKFPFVFNTGDTLASMIAGRQVDKDIVAAGKHWYNPTP